MNAIEFAISMEQDGARYYKEQAEKNQQNRIGVVSRFLAEAEQAHEELLRLKMGRLSSELPEMDASRDIQNVFKELGDIKSEIRQTPKQIEFYRTALELEQESIDLYERLSGESTEATEKMVFLFLRDQEKQHYTLLDTLVTMLRHAEEWVESPEFGLRKETY